MKRLTRKFLNTPTSAQPPPAFQLSDDILISIFMLNVEQLIDIDNWTQSEVPWDHRPILQCTMRRTSQVCRRWRLVALTCPALWSNIELSCKNLRWIQEMINRAIMRDGFGRVSLSCYKAGALSQITPELLSHAYSYYGIVSARVWSVLANELTSPTTKLDSLCVFLPFTQNLIGTLGTVIKPCLKRLSFDSYFPRFDITHSNLSSITTFIIRKGSFVNPEYTISEILSALANMPLLRELSLFVSLQDDIHQPDSINLPFLTRLKLNGSYFSIYLLLSHIDFPLSCLLRISCDKKNDTTLPITNILDHILTLVAKHMAYRFTHNLRITLGEHVIPVGELPAMQRAIPRNRKDNVWYTEICCTAYFATAAEWRTIVGPILTIFHGIFQTTTHLALSSLVGLPYPTDFVLHILQPFVTLDTVNLNGYSIFVNVVSLFKVARQNGQEDFLPALRNIELFEITGYAPSLNALIDFFAWRVERDKIIHSFDFHFRPDRMKSQKIYMTKRQLSRLRQFVVNVNVYYLKDSSDYTLLFKTAILPPTFRNAEGYCRLEPFNGIPNNRLSIKEIRKMKYFAL